MAAIRQNTSLFHRHNGNSNGDLQPVPDILPQQLFLRMLYLERKRTERSGRPFVLMLLESARLLRSGNEGSFQKVFSALANSTRDTDAKGWYQEHSTLGVIFTELGPVADGASITHALLSKVTGALSNNLSIGEINELRLSFRLFPDDWDTRGKAVESESAFYDDLFRDKGPKQFFRAMKRSMDIVGSLVALILGLPLFLFVALAVKLTSRGPILFRQERVGQYGRRFSFFKFRSMYTACDDAVHREYTKQFIANTNGADLAQGTSRQFKLVADKRVTRVGHFLRRTSLDELPQFLNVLKGEMSLVGPRPPVPYEVENYHLWHRARLLAAKPGITGLWQVRGRSRVKFDDMVRMDLNYANSWSLWLDVKILLQTPLAVLSGSGAH